jgi:hypothetical protein
MLIFDDPKIWDPKYGPSSHLMSTIPGEEGTKELKAFAKKIGLNPAWIQKEGTRKEHFDIFKSMINKAIQAGAKQVSSHELVRAIRIKAATSLAKAL